MGSDALIEIQLKRKEPVTGKELKNSLNSISAKVEGIIIKEEADEYICEFWGYKKCAASITKDNQVKLTCKDKHWSFLSHITFRLALDLKAKVYDPEAGEHIENLKKMYVDISDLKAEHNQEHPKVTKVHDIVYYCPTPEPWKYTELTKEKQDEIKNLVHTIAKKVFNSFKLQRLYGFNDYLGLAIDMEDIRVVFHITSMTSLGKRPRIEISSNIKTKEYAKKFADTLSQELNVKFKSKEEKDTLVSRSVE